MKADLTNDLWRQWRAAEADLTLARGGLAALGRFHLIGEREQEHLLRAAEKKTQDAHNAYRKSVK